jgi:chromosome segregation ATPase
MSGPGSALSALVEVRRAEAEALTRDLARVDARVSEGRARLDEVEAELRRRRTEARAELDAQKEWFSAQVVQAAALLQEQGFRERVEKELEALRQARHAAWTELRAAEASAREHRRALVQAVGSGRAAELRREELRREAARAAERRQEALAAEFMVARSSESGR